MNTKELLIELRNNNINENICLVNPAICLEGALCLIKDDNYEWDVLLNERGSYLIKEHFTSEDDACRFFLKKALSEPTNRKDFNAKDLIRLMMDVYTMNNGNREFPQDTRINVNFAEIKFDNDPKTNVEVNNGRLQQNITSPIRILMEEDPDLSYEEAVELYKKIKEENNTSSINVVNTLGSVLAGE